MPLNFWQNDIEATTVRLEIDKKYLSDIEEWLGIENVKEKNGTYIAEAKLPFDNGLVSKIMSYGSGIKVLEPTELKNKVIENAKDLLKIYK